jgi:hypothetical protein
VIVVVVVLGLVALAVIGLLVFDSIFLPQCAGCPSSTTPLGTALGLGNETGTCPAGNGSSPTDCAYVFRVTVSPPFPSAGDLSFQLWNGAHAPFGAAFLITVANPSGAWLATWYSTNSTWSSSADPGVCAGSNCLSAPLENGDSLLLRSLPNGGLPYSHQGVQLIVNSVGGGFSGFVDAPIN